MKKRKTKTEKSKLNPVLGEKWIIKWEEYASDAYINGSEISFEPDRVVFHNNIVPPSTIVKRWYSKVRFQAQKIEPTLPLIDGESRYQLKADIRCPKGQSYLLKLVYYDRYGNTAGEDILHKNVAIFQCPIKTYSYELQLINAGFTDLVFRSITIQEVLDAL